jgi:hypothetical protein
MLFSGGHALVIGVGSYTHDAGKNVPITVADAQEVASVLRDPQFCGYPEHQVNKLHDAAATREGILATLDALAANTTTDDTVFLFYSGHGNAGDDGHYYLTTNDTRWTSSKVISGTGIRDGELLERLRLIPSKRMLLIFNACHAGSISPTLGEDTPFTGKSLPDQMASALLATGEGRIIITACRESQYSFIGTGERTIFTQTLTDGLRGKGTSSHNGYISAFDLYLHVYHAVGEAVQKNIPEYLRKRYAQMQEPELTVLKGIGPFAVALYRGASALGAGDAREQLPPKAAVRAVSHEESRAALQQIQRSGISFGQFNSVSISGDVVGANQSTATIQGDYVQGDVDKRQGVFFESSIVSNNRIIGVNTGTVMITDAGGVSGTSGHLSIEQVIMKVQQTVEQAHQRSNDDLADDLEGVTRMLQAALKAQAEGKFERCAAKMRDARETLLHIAGEREELRVIIQDIAQLGS